MSEWLDTTIDPAKLRVPNLSDKDKAVALALAVLRKRNLTMSLSHTEAVLMSRELLRALCLDHLVDGDRN
jgi:hypothetical protein